MERARRGWVWSRGVVQMMDRRLWMSVLLLGLIAAVGLAASSPSAEPPDARAVAPLGSTVQAVVAPEPATLWLAILGLSGVFVRRTKVAESAS